MFGTDGVRGVANEELTPLLAMQLGQAGAYVLTRENKHKPTIMVGCDTRMSGDMLANALMAGICSVGANAVYVGVIPTPAIAYLTKKYKVEAGVVISASHNPMEFNGIKFFDGNGYKLPDALEDEIEALIKNNMNRVEFPTGSSVGRIKYRKDAREEYINHAVRAVPVDLTNLKVVVDCAEGASHYTSIEALRQLGAQVVPIHNMPDGTNINANCGSTHMEELRRKFPAASAVPDGIYSYRVHAKKPELPMFEAFEARFGVPAFYFDDRAELIEGARKHGWNAHRFVSAEEVDKILG